MGEERAAKYDAQLRRDLSFWDIAYLEIGSMIGSGWMFAPLLAASVVGVSINTILDNSWHTRVLHSRVIHGGG
jgi:hypothetical protein